MDPPWPLEWDARVVQRRTASPATALETEPPRDLMQLATVRRQREADRDAWAARAVEADPGFAAELSRKQVSPSGRVARCAIDHRCRTYEQDYRRGSDSVDNRGANHLLEAAGETSRKEAPTQHACCNR